MSERTRRSVLLTVGTTAIGAAAGCLGDDTDAEVIEIEPETTILFEGRVDGWEGIEPEAVAGATNPTLVLEDGGAYEIGWEPGDGRRHNIELRDADGTVVDGYATELTTDPDEVLAFTATDEFAAYRCNPHSSMQGEIRVE